MKNRTDQTPDYLNPEVLGIHKLDAHFEGFSYLSEKDLENDHVTTALSLNGTWRFKLYPNPAAAKDFFTHPQETADERWCDIKVPGVWELQGHGTPYYLAKSYPPQISVKKNKIPTISLADNPTGAYLTDFVLPEPFDQQRIFIRFAAVKSAFHLWINGIQAGFSKASMTSHEFEITSLVQPGVNKVAVLVYKFSDGTYLEDQDMWFFAGITRDVTVFCEPQTYLFDVFASCELIHEYTDANFKLDLVLDGALPPDLSLKVILTHEKDQIIHQGPLTQRSSAIQALIENPHLWSAETPYLYTVKLILSSGKKFIQAKKFKFGFRSVEIKETRFMINGRPIKFKGVNRHDFDPVLAWGISKETRLKDLLIMKAHNINAIRTSHYPNHPHLYELADELGFYVIDEADLESHGVRKLLPENSPIWEKASIDRNQRMVLRDRNHPCIVMWSLGNEAGEGTSFMGMRKAILALDQTRPIHYEGDKQKGLSDVYSMMYPSPELEIKYGEKQDITAQGFLEKATQLFLSRKPVKKEDYENLPILNCEYAHCMENSLGNFKEHVDNFEKYDNWIGGFIWDFVDQSIRQVDPEGNIQWLYGGDFGEEKTDAYFCANGLIASDRSLHPAISEVKQVYANLAISDYDPSDNSVLIKNKHVFIDTSSFLFIAKIHSDGLMIAQQLIEVPLIAPAASQRIILDRFPLPKKGEEILLEIDAVEKNDRPWAKKGHEIAFGQFILRERKGIEKSQDEAKPIQLRETKNIILIQSERLTATVNKFSGLLEGLDYGQGNILKAPLSYNLTRADLDNDCGIELFVPPMRTVNAIRQWEKAMGKLELKSIKKTMEKAKITLHLRHKLPHATLSTIMTFTNDGDVNVQVSMTSNKDLIRLGMTLGLDHGYRNVEFYGRGPQENYCDRKSGSKIGLYQGTISDFTHNYMRPQENGNHTDIRFLQVRNEHSTLRFEALSPRLMETSVWPYTQEELKAAKHIHELPPHKMTTVNLDYGQKGVAGDLPGFYQGPEQYKLKKGKEYVYGFSIHYILD